MLDECFGLQTDFVFDVSEIFKLIHLKLIGI
jgi:hypothetical protein